MKKLVSPLARARGLGSAKDGTEHWWAQRVTALALVPLTLWFVIAVIGQLGADHSAMVEWAGSPAVATLLILTLGVTFHHAALGTQVILEDYISHELTRTLAILAVKFACYGLATATIVSVLMLAFGG
jgi:succinate dehydrogenase / fumarate reductase, membrane anchor subunit